MLTKRENFMETIRGGHPDRFVNQFEPFQFIVDPYRINRGGATGPGTSGVNDWGVTIIWPEGTPGAFPVHDDAHKVLKDITKWKECVHAPRVVYPAECWEQSVKQAESVDRKDMFVTAGVAPGIFEKLHYLMGIEDALINFYEEPECMHELIDFIADWEIACAAETIKYVHPDALYHHDDWGSQKSTFLSPEMFEEFLAPAYKKVYGFWKQNGVEVIVHHSDSYAATLVPMMIELGIDVWQGIMTTNDIPKLIEQYGGKISFMGGIDNGLVDRVDWTKEKVCSFTEKICRDCGKLYFIPNTTMGGAMSTYPGVYDTVTAEIDRLSKELF